MRRAKGRKRLIWVAIGAAILLVLVGAVAILASSLFDVRTVDVQGAVYTDPEQLSAIVDELHGDAILLVDTRHIERQLESIAWVESARVSTQFPHRVFIDVRERKPIATFAGSDGKYRVIDRDGRSSTWSTAFPSTTCWSRGQIPMSSVVSSQVDHWRRRLSWRSRCRARSDPSPSR